MSEYQYYEWQTLDRPLTPEERAAVNELSSHIEVSSSQAVVTYSWGNFKHDPRQVLARYFDAFLYLANWGSKRLAFRFPKGLLDPKQIEPYLWEYCIDLKPVGNYLILDISLDEEEGSDWIEGEGWLSSLSRLRDDLLEGDYRALYLAWLRAAELQDTDDAELEPPVPPGLSELSPPLTSFVELFDLDEYLLQAATEASPQRQSAPAIPPEEAIARLSPAERDAFLMRLARGEAHLSLTLNRRLQELVGASPRPPAGGGTAPVDGGRGVAAAPRRMWGELWATADQLRREAKRRAAEAAEARRIQELQAFAPREAEAWRDVVALIEEKKPASYDKAVALLVRLRDLADYQGRLADFQTRVADLQERYANRPALRDRLQRARLV
ncbi:MAG: hypothetical protein FJ014_10385 [Chloroflexi bacterium]|nr:hypothetical protein [Chloroflexota bacterium]